MRDGRTDGPPRRPRSFGQSCLHVKTGGAGKPTVILVHGFAAHGFFWRKWEPALTACHRVHTIDLAGFGKAPMPKEADYSPLAQAERVAGYLCHIRAEGPQVLIGHSLGAAIVLLSALSLMENEDRPELAGIVVVSGAVYAQPLPRYLSLLRRRLLGELFLLFAPPRTALNVGIRGIVYDSRTVDSTLVDGYRSPLRDTRRRRAILRAARQIDVSEAPGLTGRLTELSVPTLLIWGEEDRVVPVENGRKLADELPRAKLVTISGVGHLPPEEAPRRSVAPVLDFLGSLSTGRGEDAP